ncbi:hypothetical protein UFOVP20_22 [uncultured Caudovirales phage]|uniref:Uncharacterized protein n=1 Tax=uncultured Caudovirales phage TaxID=2100421 RepID=A0A6J5KK64_9CAUD|nr:hypothetical protein UFOVP20_22 [uncultured Caudovirales phage]
MTDREAMKMALDALLTCDVDYDYDENPYNTFDAEDVSEAIDALRQALAQPEQSPFSWNEGYPTKHYAEEWFIALTIHGNRVVLTALPEEYKYDFTTKNGTYIKKESIEKWAQLPTSQYLPFNAAPIAKPEQDHGFDRTGSHMAGEYVDTAHPKREWQDLDEVEIIGCTCECIDDGIFNMKCAIDFAREIEVKLREKNE